MKSDSDTLSADTLGGSEDVQQIIATTCKIKFVLGGGKYLCP